MFIFASKLTKIEITMKTKLLILILVLLGIIMPRQAYAGSHMRTASNYKAMVIGIDKIQFTLPTQYDGAQNEGIYEGHALLVDIVAYAAQPLLRTLDGVKVHTGSKGTPPDVVHTTFHMSLLPSCTGIAEAVSEAIECAHA